VLRLFMTAPGVVVITALSVVSVFNDAARFRRPSSPEASLGLAPRPCESGETSRNRRISRQGNQVTGKHLYEAATNLPTRNLRLSTVKAKGMKMAQASGFRKARISSLLPSPMPLVIWEKARPRSSMHNKGDGASLLDGLTDKGHRLLTYPCDDAHFRLT